MSAETPLQRQILLKVGSRRDVRLWRINAGLFFTLTYRRVRSAPTGHSDLCGILMGGWLLAVETKSPTGRLTTTQAAFRDMVQTFGGCYILARTVKDVENGIHAFLKERLNPV